MMIAKKPPRKRTPSDVETAVLANSARRCALCFHLKGDLTEKLGQIAHLDGDRSNRSEDNLAWMCLDHHTTFDSKTSQHKNYTIYEVKDARDRLYELVAKEKHLTPAAAQPYLQAEADKKILRDFLKVVPSDGIISFLRHHDFGNEFEWKWLKPIYGFYRNRDGPDHEFLDPELETARKKFRESCGSLMDALGANTWSTKRSPDWQTVPPEWIVEARERWNSAVQEIHAAADAVCSTYDDLVRLARRKLAV